jgi:archaellum biogenesis ATPase FlaH
LKKSDIRTGLIHFSEPEPGQISDWHTLMNVLLCALQDPGRVVIVDSMKSIFSLPGSLTTGGISRAALDDLNHLSAALAASGRVVVFVLNPNSANQAVMDELDALLISNCSAVTTLKASGEQQVSQRSQTRVVRRTVSASTSPSQVTTAVDSYSITAFSNFKAE